MAEISMQDMVGKGYADLWNFKGRYVAVKGSRASKKSKTVALWIISHLVEYPLANALYIRRTERTLKDSCYSDCIWAIERLGLSKWFNCRRSPLEIEYIPTGQKILFRGCDDPIKLTSISVPKGVLCWAVFEEAYEITKESDFDVIDESIRGQVPDGYFKRVFILLNPWSECWIKTRFFDTPDTDNKLSMTTTYKCNEWLTEDDLRIFDEMKERNPRRYKIAGEGQWGIAEGMIYENWRVEDFDVDEVRQIPNIKSSFSLDFGFTDPNAFICALVDNTNYKIYIFDEWYKTGVTNKKIAQQIKDMGYGGQRIICDNAEPKSIEELRDEGINADPSRKGRDSVNHGIQLIQNYEIIVKPHCKEVQIELANYCWEKDRYGNPTDRPEHEFSHGMDSLRYGVSSVAVGETYSFD